jgi:hypothetical protein
VWAAFLGALSLHEDDGLGDQYRRPIPSTKPTRVPPFPRGQRPRRPSPDRLYAKRLGPRPPRFAKLLVPWEGLPPLFAGIDCTVATLIAAPRSGSRSGPAAAPSSLLGTSSFSATKRTFRWTPPCGGKLAGLPRRSKVDSDSDDDDDEDGGLDDVDEATEAGNQCVDLDTLHQGFTMISSKVSGPTPTDRRDADNLGISPPSARPTLTLRGTDRPTTMTGHGESELCEHPPMPSHHPTPWITRFIRL